MKERTVYVQVYCLCISVLFMYKCTVYAQTYSLCTNAIHVSSWYECIIRGYMARACMIRASMVRARKSAHNISCKCAYYELQNKSPCLKECQMVHS